MYSGEMLDSTSSIRRCSGESGRDGVGVRRLAGAGSRDAILAFERTASGEGRGVRSGPHSGKVMTQAPFYQAGGLWYLGRSVVTPPTFYAVFEQVQAAQRSAHCAHDPGE